MGNELSAQLREIENIEADDAHHDFGGPHGSKGHDFAHFWLIVRVTQLEQAGQGDYMFVCEFAQDIAEFDSSTSPVKLTLYQLKKKEDGYWTPTLLTGQTKSDTRKRPKLDKPVPKLVRSVQAFHTVEARGVFVSNAAFEVELADNSRSTNCECISLDDWDTAHTDALKVGLAALSMPGGRQIDLSRFELRKVALHVDDLQNHTNGIVLAYLEHAAPEHKAQASSLVDALYIRIKSTARRTEKCASWEELIKRRGFGKLAFQQAVQSLRATPDKAGIRQRLLSTVSQQWSIRRHARVEAALLRCARERVLLGQANRWHTNAAVLRDTCSGAEDADLSDQAWFEQMCLVLADQLPTLSDDEIAALAIYEMSEWTQNQIPG